jgi:hypothetical protein
MPQEVVQPLTEGQIVRQVLGHEVVGRHDRDAQLRRGLDERAAQEEMTLHVHHVRLGELQHLPDPGHQTQRRAEPETLAPQHRQRPDAVLDDAGGEDGAVLPVGRRADHVHLVPAGQRGGEPLGEVGRAVDVGGVRVGTDQDLHASLLS